MTSHEYANRLKALAEFLLSRPEFDHAGLRLYSFYLDKEKFLSAARSLGSLRKEYADTDFRISPVDFPEFVIDIPRNKVCRIVKPAQPAEYDCEPLLSQEEEATLERKA